jgi:hypothetical protein
MALLFMDGFDHYATTDIAKKGWSVGGGAVAIASSSGRRGGGALAAPNNSSSGCITRTMPASGSWIIGGSFALVGGSISSAPLFSLLDAGTAQCELRLNSDMTLSVTRNGTAVTNGTSAMSLVLTTTYFLEWKVTIADSISAASCKVRVNGADWITVATGQDLKNTANASASQVRIGPASSVGSGITAYYDDFYICDSSGSTNNDFLGDIRIDTIYPTSDGNYSQFTPSTGTSHFALVDEATPNTTDYNDGSTVGDYDSYGLGNLAALTSQTVYGVQVNAAIMKDDAGAKSAAMMVRSSTTNSDGASASLGTSQVYVSQVYETDPNGSIAWTETSVNAMEAGVKVTA